MSLFQGTPQTAPSYSSSTTETPKWMQDAIYNQIQTAQQIANTPYQQYSMPTVAELSPLQQQANSQVQANQGVWKPTMNQVQSGLGSLASAGTADQLRSDQGQYLRQGMVDTNLNKGQDYWNKAGSMDIMGAASPYLNQAADTTAQALSARALSAASPYLQSAGQSSANQVGQYLNPYNDAVTNRIAQLGARNLSENLLPSVSDAFVKAGGFGGSRMGEFGARALRDTQESVLGQQAQALQQGYGQSMAAAQGDLARQAQLAGTVGSISGADLSRVLQGGAQYGNLAQTAGGLTGQQQSAFANLGQMQTNAGQSQQQFGLNAAQAAQQAQASDYARQQSALQSLAGAAGQAQHMANVDTGALDAAGQNQQLQMQRQLDAAHSQYQDELLYPKQQMDWLSTQIRGMAPITPQTRTESGYSTQFSPSPLSQLASGATAGLGLYNAFNKPSGP